MLGKVSFTSGVPVLRKTNGSNLTLPPADKKNKWKNSNAYLTAALSGLAVIGLACLFSRNNKTVNNTVKKVLNEGQQVVENTVKKQNNATPIAQKTSNNTSKAIAKKHKVPSENDIIQNIDTKYLDNNGRKTVEKEQLTTVSTAQQREYNKNIAYQHMKTKQKRAVKKLNVQNKQKKQKLNSIGASQPDSVINKLYELIPEKTNTNTKTVKLVPDSGMGKFIA